MNNIISTGDYPIHPKKIHLQIDITIYHQKKLLCRICVLRLKYTNNNNILINDNDNNNNNNINDNDNDNCNNIVSIFFVELPETLFVANNNF